MEPIFILSGDNENEDVKIYSLVVDAAKVEMAFVGPHGSGVSRMDWQPGDDMEGLIRSFMEWLKKPLLNGRFYRSEISTGNR